MADPKKQSEPAKQARRQQQGQRRTYTYNSGDAGDYDFSDGFSGTDFSDFLSSLFGQEGRPGEGPRGDRRETVFRGEDYEAELHLSLRDAYRTHKQNLPIDGKPSASPFGRALKMGSVLN